ncbi:MAG: hypothetical protein KJ922_02375 [Nanoarchaeota archaeon]|nr:hypothetical protein [Nanoarchaeota archaeon]
MTIDKLRVLQPGQPVTFRFRRQAERHIDNLDDGETSYVQEDSQHVRTYRLTDIYMAPNDKGGKLGYFVVNNDGEDQLVCAHYCYNEHLHIRVSALTITERLTEVCDSSNVVPISGLNCHLIFDGSKQLVLDPEGIYSWEGLEGNSFYKRFSVIGEKACQYDPQTHTIKGNIGNLLEGYVPLSK